VTECIRQLTSDAGLLAVREMAEQLGWLKQAAGLRGDPRDPAKIEHDVLALLRQRVLGVTGGYENQNDHDRLSSTPALKIIAGRAPRGKTLDPQPTLSRFENRATPREVAQLNWLRVQHYIRLRRDDPPGQIVLDVDPTDDPCYGRQQLSFFKDFYRQQMYLPLLVFERKSGMLLGGGFGLGTSTPPGGSFSSLGRSSGP